VNEIYNGYITLHTNVRCTQVEIQDMGGWPQIVGRKAKEKKKTFSLALQ
jgi:hypothetical protein